MSEDLVGGGEAPVGTSRPPDLLDSLDVAPLRSILEGARGGLQVGQIEIAFLVVVRHELDQPGVSALPGPMVEDVYGKVSGAAGVQATSASRRSRVDSMVAQQLLIATEPARRDREPLLTLSPVGREIARAYDVGVDDLERERLTSVVTELKIKLRIILADAAAPAVDLSLKVMVPLRGAVSALVDDIARRQVRLDRRHEAVMASVIARLAGGWREALSECHDVLGQATAVARELCGALLDDTEEALGLIDQLGEALRQQGGGSLENVDRLRNEIERLRHWADDRLGRWTEYHRRVSGYIGTLVRLDPDRVVAGRLRSLMPLLGRKIAAGRAPYSVVVTQRHRYRALRPLAPAEMSGEVGIEPNVVSIAVAGDRLAAVRQLLAERARELLRSDGSVSLHRLLNGLHGIAPGDHNEICDWAVRHLATLGPINSSDDGDWRRVSAVLSRVQPLSVAQWES